jgi:peptide/nickel transport system substrate-binding protein
MSIRLRRAALCAAILAVALPAVAYGFSQATHAVAASSTLVVGSNIAPPILDPTASPSAAIDEVFDYNVYQHLAQLTPKGTIVPVLATSWKVSNAGRTYTFTIRSGVRFSNGDRLTPAAVVFSLKRVIAPKSTYPYKGLMAGVKSVRAVGTNRVAVTLKTRDWNWLYNLAAYSNGVVLDPKAVAQIAKRPVGTGPFAFSKYTPNYSVELVRNPYYWGAKTNVHAVTFRFFANANSENSALQSGQINVIDNALNPQDLGAFKGNPKYKIVAGPTNGKIQVTINNTSGPLANKLVRQAISYATNKGAVIAAAGGYGVPIASGTVPGDPWYLDLTKTYAYNPAKAKQLLAQAGFPNGFATTLTVPPYSYAENAATLVAAELTAVGIKTTIKDVQWPLWLSQVFTNHSFDLTIIDHVEARDIANYGNAKYYWNYAGSGAAAKMLAAGNDAPTQTTSTAKYKAVVRKITADAVNDWLYDPDQVTIAQRGVSGLPQSGRTESFYLGYATLGGRPSAQARREGYAG